MSTSNCLGGVYMGRKGDDATLGNNMQGYVIPLFLDLFFVISWAMIAMKAMGGNLTNGRGGGWCRLFCLILCVFQSFYGFLVVHSMLQAWSLVLMVFPAAGFIAFQGNNPTWLLGYVRGSPPSFLIQSTDPFLVVLCRLPFYLPCIFFSRSPRTPSRTSGPASWGPRGRGTTTSGPPPTRSTTR